MKASFAMVVSRGRRAEAGRRDPMLLVIAAVSLAAHLAFIVPMLTPRHEPDAPREIPVEVVQMPPPPPPAAASRPKEPPPKPAAPQQKTPPEHKQAEQKQAEQKKPDAPKAPAKAEPSKAAPSKAAQSKAAPSKDAAAQRAVAERMERLIGAMPAIALPGEAETGTEAVSYKQLVLSKVAKAKPEGRSHGIPGAASVSFTLGDAGDVVRCEIVHKSDDPNLDAEAIAMVRRGAPYPPPPPDADREFVITLRFAAMP